MATPAGPTARRCGRPALTRRPRTRPAAASSATRTAFRLVC
jgi:hypothetical protein